MKIIVKKKSFLVIDEGNEIVGEFLKSHNDLSTLMLKFNVDRDDIDYTEIIEKDVVNND